MLATFLHANQSRGRLRLSALTAGNGCCYSLLSARLYQSAHPFRSHPPRPIDTGNGENDGAGYSRARYRHPVCPSLRLRGSRGREQLRFSFGCFGLLARHLTIAGQYLGGLCGSSCGRVSIRLDRFPACFVSPAVSYPFALFPPRRPVPPHPVPIQSRLASFRLIRPIPLIASLPSLSSPLRPACRVVGTGRIS